jgi:two-component system, response regulator YesN
MSKKSHLPIVLIISEYSAELKRKLELLEKKYVVLTAMNGDQGLKVLNSQEHDVILLHLHSDWQSDVELLRHIRLFFPYLPVVILAESSTLAGAEACAGLSTQGYLRMPASPGEIWRAAESALFAYSRSVKPNNRSVASRNEVVRALSIINAQHQTGLSPQKVAQQVHMTRNHLGSLFKSETGQTLSEYINKCRVASAMRSICEQADLGFSRVAEISGFSSESYFSKVFKKLSDMTPKRFRQTVMAKGPSASGWCEKLIQNMFS